MDKEDIENKIPLFPVLVCAALSAGMMHFGFLSFLFLAPLGFAAMHSNAAASFVFAAAAVFNAIFSLILRSFHGIGISGLGVDVLYFTSVAFGFVWIMAGRKGLILPLPQVRTLYRFIIASVFTSFVFMFVVLGSRNSGFAAMISAQAEAFSSILIASAGADAARRSFLEQTMTAERILEILRDVSMRGGAVVSMLLLFFINRRTAVLLDRLIRRRKAILDLPGFYVPVNTIWALSFSIAAVLLTRLISLRVLEIAAWNVLVVCVILFLAQGAGIVIFILARQTIPPMLRLFLHIMIFVVILSPGINTIALTALVFLGITENWLPLRVQKKDGLPPTPGE